MPNQPRRNSTLQLMMAVSLVLLQPARAQTTSAPPPTIPDSYKIAGTAVSKADGNPLGRARVVLSNVKNQQKFLSVVTSEEGKFEFTELPAGKYSLFGAKRGFVSAGLDQHEGYSTAIVTGPDFDTGRLTLRLAPVGVITGRVFDESGEPVRNANVIAYVDDHGWGVSQVHQSRSTTTNDLGVYEITPLMPGTYFISASATPWYAIHPDPQIAGPAAMPLQVDRSLDVTYPVTYYDDETEADSASPISIQGGERVQADIHLSPVPALSLRFHVPDNGQNGFVVPQLQQIAFDGSTSVTNSGARVVSPGVMEITGVPAGRYNVRVGGDAAVQMNDVDFTKDGQEIDTSNAEALSTIKVSAQVPGETAIPSAVGVGLRAGHKKFVAWQQIDAKGEAVFQQVPAGRYEIVAWGFGSKRYSLSHVAAEGGELSGRTLTVTGGSSPSLSLTLVGGTAQVQGTVKRAGKVVAGAMVLLIPKEPDAPVDLFRRDQSDMDGTFNVQGVVPGSYTLVAIENGWDLDWSQPGVIAAYIRKGKPIEVSSSQGEEAIKIEEPIDAQPK
jgi:uncharacterized surface anchored protein